jgi:hypothetical protein
MRAESFESVPGPKWMRGVGKTENSNPLSIDTAMPPLADKHFAAMRAEGRPTGYAGHVRLLVATVEADADGGRLFRLAGCATPIDHSPFDADSLAADQRVGHLFASRLDDPAKGLAGDLHLFGGIGMVQPFEIGKSEGFDFIDRQHNVLKPGRRDAFGQKAGDFGKLFDRTAVKRSAGAGLFHGSTSIVQSKKAVGARTLRDSLCCSINREAVVQKSFVLLSAALLYCVMSGSYYIQKGFNPSDIQSSYIHIAPVFKPGNMRNSSSTQFQIVGQIKLPRFRS